MWLRLMRFPLAPSEFAEGSSPQKKAGERLNSRCSASMSEMVPFIPNWLRTCLPKCFKPPLEARFSPRVTSIPTAGKAMMGWQMDGYDKQLCSKTWYIFRKNRYTPSTLKAACSLRSFTQQRCATFNGMKRNFKFHLKERG